MAIFILGSTTLNAAPIRYQASFGRCPGESAGKLTLKLIKEFEKKKSLFHVKKVIHQEKLQEKYFLSRYEIEYGKQDRFLKINLQCPLPLFKAIVFDKERSYEAIFVEKGKMIDPSYESLVQSENKKPLNLPTLSIPIERLKDSTLQSLSELFGQDGKRIQSEISEVILRKNNELIVILTKDNRPITVFLGNDFWERKVIKLNKILKYFSQGPQRPSIINLTNLKKNIVKFNDSI